MTVSPERLRRRRRIEGAVLVIIGIMMLSQSFYSNAQDKNQRECLSDSFRALTEALDARSDLNKRESDSIQELVSTVSKARGDDEVVDKAFETYLAEQAAVEKVRSDNPFPPYPEGICD